MELSREEYRRLKQNSFNMKRVNAPIAPPANQLQHMPVVRSSSQSYDVFISTIGQVRHFTTTELDAATSGSPAQVTFRWANYYQGSHSSAVRSDMRVDGWLNGTDYRFKFTFLGYNSSDVVIATTTTSYFVDIAVSDIKQDSPYLVHRTGGGFVQRATFSNRWPGDYSGSQLGTPDFGFVGYWGFLTNSGSGALFGTASGTSGHYVGWPAPWNTIYKTAMSWGGSQYAHWQVDFPAYIVKLDSTKRSALGLGSAKNLMGGAIDDAYFLKLCHVGVYKIKFRVQLQPNLLPGYTQSDIASVSTLKKFTKGSTLWCQVSVRGAGPSNTTTLSELPGVIVAVPGDNPLGLYWLEVDTIVDIGTNGIFGTLAPTPGIGITTEDYFEPDAATAAYVPRYVYLDITAIEGYSFRVYNATVQVDGFLAFGGRIADSSETGNTPDGPVVLEDEDELEQVNDPDTGDFEPEPEDDPGSFELEDPVTATGSCCISGVCSIKTELECLSLGGTYAGDGTDCTSNPCVV